MPSFLPASSNHEFLKNFLTSPLALARARIGQSPLWQRIPFGSSFHCSLRALTSLRNLANVMAFIFPPFDFRFLAILWRLSADFSILDLIIAIRSMLLLSLQAGQSFGSC